MGSKSDEVHVFFVNRIMLRAIDSDDDDFNSICAAHLVIRRHVIHFAVFTVWQFVLDTRPDAFISHVAFLCAATSRDVYWTPRRS